MVFHWSLNDSKSPQVSSNLLDSSAVWIVSTRALIFNSCRPHNDHLVIVPSAPITIAITITFMLHSFFFFLSVPSQCLRTYLSVRFLSILLYGLSEWQNILLWRISFFFFNFLFIYFLTINRSDCLDKISWSVFISKTREFCVSHSPWWILVFRYIIYSWGQIWISCTIPRWSSSPLNYISSWALFALICSIRLSCDWSFRLYHHIAYMFYFVASYLFLHLYKWYLWRCFMLLLNDI